MGQKFIEGLEMKITACLVLVLAASAQAGFFSKVGDFFSNLAKNFGHSALDHLKDTGVSLAKNITSNTANMLAETGQMAMFELGNIANKKNGRRDISELVGKLEADLQADVEKIVAAVMNDSEVGVTSCRQILQAMLEGRLEPKEVINFLPEIQLKAKLSHALEPLAASLHKELGSLTSGLQNVAKMLLQNDLKGVAKALMDMA